jgi:hypothetical protein
MKQRLLIIILIIVMLFLGWRFIRPMNIFIVSNSFELPIDTTTAPEMFPTLQAKECAQCHPKFYDEWNTTIHSQAWTDPYFQADWHFDGSPQICKNCHIPLDRQQKFKVIGFYDDEKWDPILKVNPDFDRKLQHEGVTCTVCHLREGKIVGVIGDTTAPHPVEKITHGNQICVRCHVVSGERWDTFFKFPPCGTVAEIQSGKNKTYAKDSNDMSITEIAALGCVDCHMPLTKRPLVPNGPYREVRQHLWRGGHDPEQVKKGLTISFKENISKNSEERQFSLLISNTGAAHYIPTGTPDRHITVELRLLSQQNKVLKKENHILKRTIMWRPFIVDLWDTRLAPGEKREYLLNISHNMSATPAYVEAQVQYHLLDEVRRQRISYENKQPISYSIFQKRINISKLFSNSVYTVKTKG